MPTIKGSIAPTPRAQLALTARGLIAESQPLGSTGGGTPAANAASGAIVMALVGLRAGDVITNCHTRVAVVGVSLSFAKLGLYDSSGNFLAATGSVSATFNVGVGIKTVALTSPYTITADGGYYVAFLQYGSGATGAQIERTESVTGAGVQVGSFPRHTATVANQTDLSGNVTPADISVAYWLAVS